MAMITLLYSVDNPQNVSQATATTKMAAPVVFEGELAMLGMDLVSDVTVPGPTTVARTIVLETNLNGDTWFPTDAAKQYATRNLYRQALSLKLPGRINAAEPVVVP